jgi:hypothetical protein
MMEQAGRDFAELELTALAAVGRTSATEIRAYREAGVHVLYMLPLSRDPQALIREMRAFAQQMRAENT